MKYLNNYLEFSKLYRSEIKNTKTLLLIIANIWLLLIFWKILLVSDVNIVNNNVALTKATLLLQPILSILGIDVLSPNMLKMMVLTFIVMVTNLSILYFNQMASIIVLTIFARYGHKSYTNYLKNQENLSYLGFEANKDVIKQLEPQTIIIENTPVVAGTANHTHWGVWLALGLGLIVCIGLLVYSHNNLSNNLIGTNEASLNLSKSLNTQINNLDKKATHMNSQIDLIFENHGKRIDKLVDSDNLLNQKIDNLEITVQNIGSDLVRVNELGNANVLKLSQQSLALSHEAKSALAEIADASNTVEATTIGLAKVVELINNFSGRLDVAETRLDSLTGSNTPRRIGNMVLNPNPLSNIRKPNE